LANKELALDQQEKYIQQLKNELRTFNSDADQRIETLQLQIENLKAALSSQQAGPDLEQMQSEIRQLTNENEQLQIMLSRANARIRDLETQAGQTGPIRLSMQNQIISLDSVAANVKLQINQQLQQKHLNLEIINPDGRQMIKTDPELLQNILLGLLENAIQVSQAGNAIQLSQRLSFETGMLIIEVTDFGEGLTPEEQKAFFSADYNAMPGIGSISAIRNAIRAIRVLNGKIWLRSKKWNFTTFRVQLPVRIID
jgi:signal transduction histidine kinase